MKGRINVVYSYRTGIVINSASLSYTKDIIFCIHIKYLAQGT